MWMAPTGHLVAHIPHPKHFELSILGPLSSSNVHVMAPLAQTSVEPSPGNDANPGT